tara:strand:+ start:5006 stop:5368 length:363 start_codon:yes stop_codon:yes gene_type:complete
MSLDVMLVREKWVSYDEGKTHTKEEECIYDANITHNLGEMAKKAGIYKALWRPEEIDCKYAKDIIGRLEVGLKNLKENPHYFKRFNSPNGWGMYEHFVPFVEEYLKACKIYSYAEINISR